MNFITFPVNTTNIFPIANSTKGGQLVTEFNLRSIDSVSTDETIKYMVGPSFVHSNDDFYVSLLTDSSNYFPNQKNGVSSSVLQIQEGRGVINGHFIETLAPMIIDLAKANSEALTRGEQPLSGNLIIGLRIMYSTEITMAGAILPETKDLLSEVDNPEDSPSAMYEGIQVVILPPDQFFLPVDKPNDPGEVTAHIKLAEFNYTNGSVKGLKNNYPDKCKMLPAIRVGDVEKLISNGFVSKSGLQPNKLYTYAGYSGKNNSDGNIVNDDTWCESMDSLMVWDNDPSEEYLTDKYGRKIKESDYNKAVPESYKEATFRVSGNKVQLYLPHKQLHYNMADQFGNLKRYKHKEYDLPVADFSNGTPGTVDAEYTNNVKSIKQLISNLYNLPAGKQRYYIDELTTREVGVDGGLPELNQRWNPGDYILVGTDHTLRPANEASYVKDPSSIYVVLPGFVKEIQWSKRSERVGREDLLGAELARRSDSYENYGCDDKGNYPSNPPIDGQPGVSEEDNMHILETINSWWDFSTAKYRGTPTNKLPIPLSGDLVGDYFTVEYTTQQGFKLDWYYVVTKSGKKSYSDPILLTGEIPLAQISQIGGFLNVSETDLDYGYVIRDDDGHLRLLDYAMLRSGTLAYQLGEDFTIPKGSDYEEIQELLNEYVNQRVAFPNYNHVQVAENPNVININLYLSKAESESIINIYDIDSRFNTSICINIYGDLDYNTVINISDCQRVHIGDINGYPTINLYRSCLYYNADVLDRMNIIRDMSLWYQAYESDGTSVNLVVNDMTVQEIDSPPTGEAISWWSMDTPNDNHFMYALQSITFDSNGYIIGCTVLVKNTSTSNIELGKCIITGGFKLPQGTGLQYPLKRLNKRIKITGQFISAYTASTVSNRKMLIQDTKFTLLSPSYTNGVEDKPGSASFLVDSFYVSNTEGLTDNILTLDGWEPDSYHVFFGNTIS